MKTNLKKNKKLFGAELGILLIVTAIVVGMFASSRIVFAQGGLLPTFISPTEAPTSDNAVQTGAEVNVKYIFENEMIFKEEKIKAKKGQLLDSGDLPELSDDMKFIDEFLFYEVKGDGKDEIIRKVERTKIKDKESQTGNGETQTELSKDDISKMEKEAKELKEKLDKLNNELRDKDKLSDKHKEKIKDLEDEIESLKGKVKKGIGNKDLSEDMKKEIDKLTEKVKELEKKAAETNKAHVTSQSVTPISPISGIKSSSGISPQTPQTSISSTGKGSSDKVSSDNTTKDASKTEVKEKEKEVHYPNKLTAKAPANKSQDSSIDGTSKSVNTNKGIASSPSKARASVTENKDNANKDYPIHHGDGSDNKKTDQYTADARQFITFQTKNGKTFYLIINHDETQENVMLLTEVSEDDLLNMVEKKETPKREVVKEEPVKEEVKPEKKDENINLGTYIILLLVVGGALGGGYYFKVVKKKEDKELEALEEEDDDFFSEAESEEEINDADEVEDEE
ncbi:TPA: CD1107 family mobile element protein [Streptococcus agalactiae]|nr:membrane protein [Streptococcus pneumoniae]